MGSPDKFWKIGFLQVHEVKCDANVGLRRSRKELSNVVFQTTKHGHTATQRTSGSNGGIFGYRAEKWVRMALWALAALAIHTASSIVECHCTRQGKRGMRGQYKVASHH